MSISKGGQSVKPYVGSKEVQKAYVGSQLVYSAAPPYNYYFVGGENSYFISPNVALPSTGASITKKGGTGNYKISNSRAHNYITLNDINQFVGWKLKFTASTNSGGLYLYANLWGASTYTQVSLGSINGTEKLIIMPVTRQEGLEPTSIQIYTQSNGTFYLDNIRFEEA